MKLLIIVFVLAFWTIPSIDNRKLEWKSMDNKEAYLKTINDLRRQFAKEKGIPNMNKLVWDDFLETRSAVYYASGNWKTCRETWRSNDAATQAAEELYRNGWLKYDNRKEMIEGFGTGRRMGSLENFTPGQERIGCAPNHLSYINDADVAVVYDVLCIVEPDCTGASWNHELAEAGSACPEGFQNEDGLCAPPATPSAEKSSSGESTASSSGENTEANGSFYINLLSSMILILCYQIL